MRGLRRRRPVVLRGNRLRMCGRSGLHQSPRRRHVHAMWSGWTAVLRRQRMQWRRLLQWGRLRRRRWQLRRCQQRVIGDLLGRVVLFMRARRSGVLRRLPMHWPLRMQRRFALRHLRRRRHVLLPKWRSVRRCSSHLRRRDMHALRGPRRALLRGDLVHRRVLRPARRRVFAGLHRSGRRMRWNGWYMRGRRIVLELRKGGPSLLQPGDVLRRPQVCRALGMHLQVRRTRGALLPGTHVCRGMLRCSGKRGILHQRGRLVSCASRNVHRRWLLRYVRWTGAALLSGGSESARDVDCVLLGSADILPASPYAPGSRCRFVPSLRTARLALLRRRLPESRGVRSGSMHLRCRRRMDAPSAEEPAAATSWMTDALPIRARSSVQLSTINERPQLVV
jgi:hypothetical protein